MGNVWAATHMIFSCIESVVLVMCKIHISFVGHMIAISAVLNVKSYCIVGNFRKLAKNKTFAKKTFMEQSINLHRYGH